MAVPDYLQFEEGNPISAAFTGEWFETTGLFGYFEKYRVRADGTLWLTPTQLTPSGKMQKDVDAPELVKVDRPEVQILLRSQVYLTGDKFELVVTFREGKVESIRELKRTAQKNQMAVFYGADSVATSEFA